MRKDVRKNKGKGLFLFVLRRNRKKLLLESKLLYPAQKLEPTRLAASKALQRRWTLVCPDGRGGWLQRQS